ncbi:MAG: hypothetical protein KF708_22475 [Pirellulales bacterium]|nr:hypothetical protein [Pirellulales bacterium]
MSTAIDTITCQATVELLAADSADRPATVRVLAYSGGMMRPSGIRGDVVVDLAGLEIPERHPLLLDHAHSVNAIAGSGVPKIEGQQLIVEGEIARDTDAGKRVIALSKAKVPLAASVGLHVIRMEEVYAGEKVTVNGRKFTAGKSALTIVRASQLYEVSFVAVGADPKAGVSSLAAQRRNKHMSTETVHDDDTIDLGHEERELERQDQIKALFAQHADVKWVDPAEDGKAVKASTFMKHAIKTGMDPLKVRVQLLRAGLSNGVDMERRPAIQVTLGPEANPDLHAQALSCAVARQLGMAASAPLLGKNYGFEHVYSEPVLELSDTKRVREMCSLHALMDGVIRTENGSGFHGSRTSPEFVDTYVRAAKSLEASGGAYSTLTVSHVLEDAGGKMMLQRLALAEPVWPRITKQVSADNFHPRKLYRADADLGLLPLNPQGEIQHGRLTDSKRTVAPDTVARMISLDRRHIRNDDLGAFAEIMNGLADGANWAAESLVFTVLLGNLDNFFHSSNGNAIDAPLGLSGLETAETAFGSHVGVGGKPVAGSAAILLVGNALSVTGRQLLAPLLLNVDNNSSAITQANPHASRYQLIKSPYMDVTTVRTPSGAMIPNQSPTKWLLLSSPNIGSVVTVALLDGAMAPTIQSSETSFDTLGLAWRAYWDIGAAQGDVEYGVMSTGDASG